MLRINHQKGLPIMTVRTILLSTLFAGISTACAVAQDAPQITMGNGEKNSITVEGLSRIDGVTHFSEIRVDGGCQSTAGRSAAAAAENGPEQRMVGVPAAVVPHHAQGTW